MATIANHRYQNYAIVLAVATVIIALGEAIVSGLFGIEEESLTLFGFGVESLIEVISAIGVVHMIVRMRWNPEVTHDGFERTALRITGTGFYFFVVTLTISAGISAIEDHSPRSGVAGMVIAAISMILMVLLILTKTHVGRVLQSDAILADAACAKVCVYMSLVVMVSSAVYTLSGIGVVDSIGSLALAYFSWKEGRECFEKARSNALCGCNDHCSGQSQATPDLHRLV